MEATRTALVRITLIDVLGYVGVALALAGTAIALEEASIGAQSAAGMVTTVALLAAGWVVGGEGASDPQHRMRGIFWFLALQSWSQVVTVLLGPEGADMQGRTLVLVSGLLLAALAIPLWWIERRSLQLIGAFVAVITVAGALLYSEDELFGQPIPDITWSAVAVAVIGAAMLWLGARALLRPQRTAMVLGSLALILGVLFATLDFLDAAMSGGELSDLSALAVLLASVLVLFAGERAAIVAVFGIGVIGILGAVLALVAQHAVSETDGIVVLVLGLVLLGATIVVVKSAWGGGSAATPAEPVPPAPPEVPAAPTPPEAPAT